MASVKEAVIVSDIGQMYQVMHYYFKGQASLQSKIQTQSKAAAEYYGRGRERRDIPVGMIQLTKDSLYNRP